MVICAENRISCKNGIYESVYAGVELFNICSIEMSVRYPLGLKIHITYVIT